MICRLGGVLLVELSHFCMEFVWRYPIIGLTFVIVQSHFSGPELLDGFLAQSILNKNL